MFVLSCVLYGFLFLPKLACFCSLFDVYVVFVFGDRRLMCVACRALCVLGCLLVFVR